MNRFQANTPRPGLLAPIAFAALIAALILPFASAAGPAIEVSLKPETGSIASGAPLKMALVLKNNAAAPVSVDFRDDGREALAFSVRDAAGKEVAAADYFKPRGGAYPALKVEEGKTEIRPAFLNRWISTRLPAGEYEVRGRLRYRSGDAKTPVEAIAGFKITITAADAAAAQASLEALREVAQSEPAPAPGAKAPEKKAEDPEATARHEARTRLAMADYPEATAYRTLLFCACTECGGVEYDDAAGRIKSRPELPDVEMLIDVVRQTACSLAGRNAARSALAEIFISSRDEGLKRKIRPALDVAVPKP